MYRSQVSHMPAAAPARFAGDRGLSGCTPGELIRLRARYAALLSDPLTALPAGYIRAILAEIDGLLSVGEAAA